MEPPFDRQGQAPVDRSTVKRARDDHRTGYTPPTAKGTRSPPHRDDTDEEGHSGDRESVGSSGRQDRLD